MKKLNILLFAIILNANDNIVELEKCQYRDKFSQHCLYKEKIHFNRYNRDIRCKTKCQHWDKFFSKCHYESKCEIYDDYFIKTKCKKWDKFFNKCLEEYNRFIFFDKDKNTNDKNINIIINN